MTTLSSPVVVTVTPYAVQLGALNRTWRLALSPDDAQALVVQLVAAIKTLTRPITDQRVH